MAVGLQLAGKNDFVKVQENINNNLTKLDEAIDFNLLATLGIEYGGILNNTNAKTAGVAYYDQTGKKLYKCIANTSINYADASYFKALSNNDLLGELNNLTNLVDYIIETGQTNGWYWTKFKSGKISQMKEYIPKSQYETIELGVPMSNSTISIFGIGKAVQNLKVVGVNSATNVIYAEFEGAQLGSSYVRVIARNYHT